ncbi:hypothetical protein RHMOL_Rhmol04G0183400 [Rhododendron molle]|uniref:Uncharacterized protein n=1 Tax=Rhododendron molle TaxID=49168 RepID=A0ACC0P242_RHOML|nr:hypothetical protein RHMOL_Rhmol04G0183400 [Rhododendron molle]
MLTPLTEWRKLPRYPLSPMEARGILLQLNTTHSPSLQKHEPNVDLYSVVVVVIFFLFLWIVLVKLDQSTDRPQHGGQSQLEEQTKSSRPSTPWIAAICRLI